MSLIELTEEEKQELINSYESKLHEINEEKVKIIDRLSKLMGRPYKEVSNTTQDEIDFKFTWKGIAFTTLKEANEFLTTEEIYNHIVDKHPSFSGIGRKKALAGLSGGLSQHRRNDVITTIENPYGKGNFWGLKDWVKSESFHSYLNKLGEKGYDKDALNVEVEQDDEDLPF